MGIDWWEHDPSLSSRNQPQLAAEDEQLREPISVPERAKEVPS
jgi:hypothetical protein